MSIPTGGETDEMHPMIVNEKTFPMNFSTNFNANEIIIQFDEYFTLSNPKQNVLISPTMTETPTYNISGKKLIIGLNEKLKDNTTYSFNFGNNIKDYNEGNELPNFQYVFSTGDYLDSLSYSGKVYDAFTNEPYENAFVFLYDELEDSVPLTKKPQYFSKSDKSGNFKINYIKEGSYKVFVLNDLNNNLIFDQPTEAIDYLNEAVNISSKSNDSSINEFFVFVEEEAKLKLSSSNYTKPSNIELVFNQSVEKLEIKDLENNPVLFEKIFPSRLNDTFNLWKKDYESLPSKSLIFCNDSLVDTLRVRAKKIDPLNFPKFISSSNEKIELPPNAALKLQFNFPIEYIDTSLILLIEDSTYIIPVINIDTAFSRQLILNYPFNNKKQYLLKLKDSSLTSFYNNYNASSEHRINSLPEDAFGSLKLNITNELDEQLVFQLLKGETIIEEKVMTEKFILNIPFIKPGEYTARVFVDIDKNKRWSSGNYKLKTFPEETIWFTKPLKVREKWTIEEDWILENE